MDAVWSLISLLSDAGTTEGAPRVTRPEHLRARKADAERARAVRRRMEETRWEGVDDA